VTFTSTSKLPNLLWVPSACLCKGYRSQSGLRLKQTAQFHLVSELRMGGFIYILPLYAFLAWPGKFYLLYAWNGKNRFCVSGFSLNENKTENVCIT
jgi:hypothetical protein